jgi:hypothetical protein
MLALGFTGMIVASLLGACADARHTNHDPTPAPEQTITQVSIYELSGNPGERRLEMAVNSCNADPTVEAVETEDEVRLTATIIGEHSGLECLDSAEVTLQEPLGDRQVRDTLTGEVLEVGALEQG